MYLIHNISLKNYPQVLFVTKQNFDESIYKYTYIESGLKSIV